MDRSRTGMPSVSSTPDYDRSQVAGAYPYNGKVLLAAVILLSIVIFFVILLHIYARWFLGRRPGIAHVVSEPLQTPASLTWHIDEVTYFSKGLDAGVVASLPTFVCEGKEGENGILDCVVCLSVMEEGEIGRVLPRCKHGFHVECIDMWLGSHSTCPICRAQVKGEETSAVVAGEAVVVEVVEDEVVVGDEELGGVNGGVEGNVTVELSLGSTISCQEAMMKGDGSSSSLSSFSSSSSSLSCSLKRMVSKSRSESRVFPSAIVN